MTSNAVTPDEYISELPENRKSPMQKIRKSINENRDPQLQEEVSYGMIGYMVPLSKYPDGYHCDPKLPLPFMNLASQKNYISFYHMGLYDNDLKKWFTEAYQNEMGKKPDMGKCCVRFKNMQTIPYDLLGKLAGKMSADQWIAYYDKTLNNTKTKKAKK